MCCSQITPVYSDTMSSTYAEFIRLEDIIKNVDKTTGGIVDKSTRGINAPACSIESLSNFDVSIKGYLILIIAGRYLALLCAMLIIYFLSAKLKSVISTFLAATAVLILPILLALLGIGFFDYVLLNPILIGNI